VSETQASTETDQFTPLKLLTDPGNQFCIMKSCATKCGQSLWPNTK